MDDKLTWEANINDVVIPKVLKKLRMLRSFRSVFSLSQVTCLYNSLVLPHFDYCSSLWRNCVLVLKAKSLKSSSPHHYPLLTGLILRPEERDINLFWCIKSLDITARAYSFPISDLPPTTFFEIGVYYDGYRSRMNKHIF
jgi:hypothetical protein